MIESPKLKENVESSRENPVTQNGETETHKPQVLHTAKEEAKILEERIERIKASLKKSEYAYRYDIPEEDLLPSDKEILKEKIMPIAPLQYKAEALRKQAKAETLKKLKNKFIALGSAITHFFKI
jgi:hypothetical protein